MGQYFVRASDYPLGTRLSSLGFHSVNGEDAQVIETDLLGKAFAVVGEGSGTGRDLTLPSNVIDTTLPYRFHAVTQRAALTSPAGYFVAFDSANNYFRLGRRNRQLVIERLQNGSFSALASGGNDNDRNDEKQLWSAYIDANQQSISTEFLSGLADPDSLTVNTSNAFLLVSEPGLLFRSGPEEAYDFFEIGIGTNGDPAPTGPVDPGGDEVGDITSAASSTDSWAAQVQSSVSLTSTAAASDQATAIASVNLSIMEAAQATDATGDAPAAVGSMTGAATGNDTVDALASAAAAISAGAAAGESWTVQAQVLVNLVEQGAASDEIRRQTESAVTAALEAQSLASDQFIAALDTISSLSDSASVTDAYQAVVLQLASIASGAVASDSFRMLFGLRRAMQEAAMADASFSISYAFVNALRSGGLSGDAWALVANLNASLSDVCSVADLMSVRASTTARLTAGAIASSSFAIVNAGVRYLIMGAVILRDALQYRVNTKPALNQSVKIKPGH